MAGLAVHLFGMKGEDCARAGEEQRWSSETYRAACRPKKAEASCCVVSL